VDSPDPTAVITLFLANAAAFDDFQPAPSRLRLFLDSFVHLLRANSRKGSRKNIHAHYDLGNEFYSHFLGPTMMYSCALFDPNGGLENAQINKNRAMIERAGIREGDHVLEIGCGWGGFAIAAARYANCKVTGVTISQAQHDWATRAVKEAGLEHRITILNCDYRDIQGSFDRIVSIEMIEAVGHKFLPGWFGHCERLLKPGGKLAVQAILIPDNRYESYKNSCDWIRKYIFPGGHLPSPSALRDAMSRTTRLVMENFDDIGLHYAPTLAQWRDRFVQSWHQIQPLGFDARFSRMWQYYLSYCEAAFAAKHLHVYQIAYSKPG
jgi:cyclopropane-fatty-acyl-phospholipid synthase